MSLYSLVYITLLFGICYILLPSGPIVWWLACLIFTAAIGVRIPAVAVKFHNVYDYTIERHTWQVSENHKPRVQPSHVREIG